LKNNIGLKSHGMISCFLFNCMAFTTCSATYSSFRGGNILGNLQIKNEKSAGTVQMENVKL